MAKPVLVQARLWATKYKLFGSQAFLRYVMLRFLENVNQVSEDLIFKGGNLLWVYIQTPRSTIDLDLSTQAIQTHAEVKKILTEACAVQIYKDELDFSIHFFKEIEQDSKQGAAVTIAYKTSQGASNQFEMDIVYALLSDTCEIPSPIHADLKIKSVTVENIITDKLAACHRFGSGNTRMKDFDDLWRLSQSDVSINKVQLLKILKSRKVSHQLDTSWINSEMKRVWASHQKRYDDLPEKLEELFKEINQWLKNQV